MISELAIGLNSAKVAMDLAKGLNAANTQIQINDVKLALQERIFEIREALNAAQEAEAMSGKLIRDLEAEIGRLKNWEGEKQRYELNNIGGGAFAYMAKKGMDNGEPPHWLCANCFQRGHPAMLQFQKSITDKGAPIDAYRCNDCGGELAVPHRVRPTWKWAA